MSDIGRAVGKVEINVSQVDAARNQVRTYAADMERSFTGVNAAVNSTQESLAAARAALQAFAATSTSSVDQARLAVQAYATGVATSMASATAAARSSSAGLRAALASAAAESNTKYLQSLAPVVKKSTEAFGGLTSQLRQLAPVLGLSFGAAGVVQVARMAVELDRVATAYKRQNVAAVNLAGSQSKLNELLRAYDSATGGAIDRASALADVTKLQAVGFADTAKELERFVVAARGISVAMGSSQDYVISQLQLAIANQSTLRLDQLGLGVSEVKQRIDELKAADKNLTNEMAYQNAILGLAEEKFGKLAKSAEAQATGMEKLAKSWADLRLTMGQAASGPLEQLGRGTALFIDMQTARLKAWMAEVNLYIRLLRFMGMAGPWLTTGESAFVGGSASRDRGRHGRGQGSGGIDAPRFTEEQTAAIVDFYKATGDAERNAHNERLQATVQYESQRTQTIRDFGKSMAREEEDFNTARARSLRDYERSVMSILRASQKREAEWAQDLAESLAETRAKSAERLADIEKNYNRARERAAESYGKSLRDAAGRLDAKRVSELQADYRTQEKERKEAYNDQLDKERANLAESLRQAQEAHNERLTDARNADAERLADMRLNRALQLSDEDADRVTRKARAFQDHNDQLAEMDRQHALRMQQIDDQLLRENTRLKEGLDEFLGRTKTATEAAIAYYDALNNALIGPRPQNPYITQGGFPSLGQGGDLPMPERTPTGGWGGGASTSSVTIAAGAIVIYAAASQSPNAIGAAVRYELGKILQEVAG